MKRILFVGLFVLLSPGVVRAQAQPYRVVFDLTSRDSLEQKAVLRWIREVGTSSPTAQMEVVMYAKGFELVMPERSAYLAEVKEAMKSPNVTSRSLVPGPSASNGSSDPNLYPVTALPRRITSTPSGVASLRT